MAKYIIDSDTLEGLADAIRSVTGFTKKYTPEEMINEVKDILNATTFILVDENDNEYPAAYVDSDTVITAGANDIRKGFTAITSEGVVEGTKVIPAYYVNAGYKLITAGSRFILPTQYCDYQKLQAIICPFDTNVANSVLAEKVAIDGAMYNVSSNEMFAEIIKDSEKACVDFGFINETDSTYLIHYFMYTEVY